MMFAPIVLLAIQAAAALPDSTYSSEALRTLVARASESNRRIPEALGGYKALVESEVSLLLNRPEGTNGAVAGTAAASSESAAQIEQFEIRAEWERSGRYLQQVIGYRSSLSLTEGIEELVDGFRSQAVLDKGETAMAELERFGLLRQAKT